MKQNADIAMSNNNGFLDVVKKAVIKFAKSEVKNIRNDLQPKNRKKLISRYLLGLIIFYYEVVFKLSTTRIPLGISFLYIFLYSIAWGLIGYILSSILKPKKNRIVRSVLIILNAIPFIVEYLVYLQFKVLYDLNTVTAGADGVLHGFMGHVARLVISFEGFSHLVLFLLPFILYTFLLKNLDPAKHATGKRRIHTVIVIIFLFFFTWILILINGNARRVYKKEYDFQSAVGNFGLYTGLRLEIRNGMFQKDVTFETEDADFIEEIEKNNDNTEAGSNETEVISKNDIATETDANIVYGENSLDIDFEKLAENASGTNKDLDTYLATQTPSKQNKYTGLFKGKNLIMITAEAFSGDIIDPELTPTLYRLANKGIKFNDYYMQSTAGTTGGEFEHIFGILPMDGGKSMTDMTSHPVYMNMGAQLDRLGYYGKMYHNNDYTYYDRDKTHVKLGYSDGYMGYGNGMEEYVTKAWPESDLEMFQGTFPLYKDKEPFNIYYMTVSGHSMYTPKTNAMSKKNWDKVENLEYSPTVKAYVAANLELESALTWLIKELEDTGLADDTVIVLTADHFPYGLDYGASLGNMPYLSELYGYNVVDYLHRDHNTLIIWSGALEKMDPIEVNDPVSSMDILPTVSNLFGTEFDSRLFPGRDVFSDAEPLVFNLSYDWKTDLGTYISASGKFTPNEGVTDVPDDYVDNVKKIVRNKVNYMSGLFKTDYYGHVLENYEFKDEKITRDKRSRATSGDAEPKDDTDSGTNNTDDANTDDSNTDNTGN